MRSIIKKLTLGCIDILSFIVALFAEFIRFEWYEKTLFLLMIVRSFYKAVPNNHVYFVSDPNYTWQVLYYFFITALFELNVFYFIFRKGEPILSLIFTLFAFGNVVDHFSAAAIEWTAGKVIWLIVACVFALIFWKKQNRN